MCFPLAVYFSFWPRVSHGRPLLPPQHEELETVLRKRSMLAGTLGSNFKAVNWWSLQG